MVSIFWNAKGILLIDYVEKDQIMNGEYYGNLLDELSEKIMKEDWL